MKNILSIFLAVLTLNIALKDIDTFISFKVQQDYIAENFCVFRAVPDNDCKGMCYLNKQIQSNHEEEKKPNSTVPKEDKTKEIILIIEPGDNATGLMFSHINNYPVHNEPLPSPAFLTGIFHPPRV